MRRFVYIIFFTVILVACQKDEERDLISKLQGDWQSFEDEYLRCTHENLTIKENQWTVNYTCSSWGGNLHDPIHYESTFTTTATIVLFSRDKFTLHNVIEVEEREGGPFTHEKDDITYYIHFYSKDEFCLTENEDGWHCRTWIRIQ